MNKKKGDITPPINHSKKLREDHSPPFTKNSTTISFVIANHYNIDFKYCQ